jgi:PAS domain-containing protein
LQRALEGVTTDGIEIRGEAISPTTTDRSLIVSLRPMWASNDSIIGVLISLQDVTDRPRAATALETRTRDLEEVERIAALGSWTWRVGTQECRWSDQLYRIFGRNPASFQPTLDAVNRHSNGTPDRRSIGTPIVAMLMEP